MHHRQYKFTVPDIAKAAGIPESRVRYAIRKGGLVPGNLEDLAYYVMDHKLREYGSCRNKAD